MSNQPNSLANELRRPGIDVQTAVEARMAGHKVPDPIQLSWAAVASRVFVTGDWDFLVYGATVHPHAGVIIIPRSVSIGDSIRYLELLADGYEPDDMRDRIVVFPNVEYRVSRQVCGHEWPAHETRCGLKPGVNVNNLSESRISYGGRRLIVERISS